MCRTARRVLLRQRSPVDPDRLTFAALRSRHPHERRAAIELAGAHDHWAAVILLLRILATPDADTQARAMTALRAWESRYNKVFTRPTRAQVDELESLVKSAHLDDRLRSRLRALGPALRSRCI